MILFKIIFYPFVAFYKECVSIGESFTETRQLVKQQKEYDAKMLRENAPNYDLPDDQIHTLKEKYGYWDLWSGSRYERVQNPILMKDKDNKVVYPTGVLQAHPIYGWRPKPTSEQ